MSNDANICATIDDAEYPVYNQLLKLIFGNENEVATVPIRVNPSGRPSDYGFALTHEYALFFRKSNLAKICRVPRTERQQARFNQVDKDGVFEFRNFRREGSNSDREDGQRQYYPIYANLKNGVIRVPSMEWDENKREWLILENPSNNETIIYPVNDSGREKNWRWSEENVRKDYSQFVARVPKYGTPQVYYKYRAQTEGTTPLTLWVDKKYSATDSGTAVLKNILNNTDFSYPKSIYAVEDCVKLIGASDNLNSLVLDYFAGSGTTAHAVIEVVS